MWMNFGIKDLIDVLLVAFFLYQTYKLMKNSGTLAIFSGVVSFIIVWILVSQVLEMRLMGAILDKCFRMRYVVFWWRSVRTGDGSFWEKYFRRRTMTRRTKGSSLPRLSWLA